MLLGTSHVDNLLPLESEIVLLTLILKMIEWGGVRVKVFQRTLG